MKTYSIHDLEPNTYFSDSLMLDEKYILLSPDIPVSADLLARLSEWKFVKVYSEGDPEQHSERPREPGEVEDGRKGIFDTDADEQVRLRTAERIFRQALAFTEAYFAEYLKKGELPIEPLDELVKTLVAAIRDYRNEMLRTAAQDVTDKNYLVVHSVKTAVLALSVGTFLREPQHRLFELATAALLHELGMIRLPPNLYMAPRSLTPQEKKAISTHPIIGYNILKERAFSPSVSIAVLEHHERMDGSGYPRGLPGEQISQPARIIAVCCSYDALVSKRPYREGRDGHDGILNLLRDRGVQYDERILRALVCSLSIFPLGSWVTLSDGSIGTVVEANPQNPRFPLVKIVADAGGTPVREPYILGTDEHGTQIAGVLDAGEAADIQAVCEAHAVHETETSGNPDQEPSPGRFG